jgi:hypothetical protein
MEILKIPRNYAEIRVTELDKIPRNPVVFMYGNSRYLQLQAGTCFQILLFF